MINPQPDQPRIVFLFSDTGGGHRSACEAIIEALHLDYPERINTEMVDLFRQYTPPPLKYAPEIYPPLSRMPDLWKFGYRASDGRRRMRMFNSMAWPYIRRSLDRLVRENPCDLLVCVHPLMTTPVLRALQNRPVPFITVVTDMVSTHAAWFDNRSDLVIVPTRAAAQIAMNNGVAPGQIQIVGLPVAHRFCQPVGDRQELRAKLGWRQDLPTVLLVGGGEGMGPLEQVARAINHAKLPISLVVIAGRNQKLKSNLEAMDWHIPATIYGFVRQMPDFMRASDVLITKAGPGTISEAFIAGLPLILYSRLPGQEEGNVSYTVDEGAGVWAPTPELVVATLHNWLNNLVELEKTAANARRLARPQAAHQIAEILAAKVGVHSSQEQTLLT